MADKENPQPPQTDTVPPAAELNNPDFQHALKSLLAAYQPVFEQQLNLIKNPEELQKQVQISQRNCAGEFTEAYALFEKFFTEDVAQRVLPAQARELLGPIDQWRWCYRHIICCLVFGWLVCRWPRTFRGYAYYLYEYWRCVRQVIGNPVSDTPTADQRRDFDTLVKILAEAFKPYLTDQLATVEYPAGVPDEIFSGEINCFSDDRAACAIFERLLTTEAARALLGEAAFKQNSQQKFFWFCRCWCLCSLCFGCCLARARTVQQLLLCLYAYFLCLRDCFRPLTCAITSPAPGECAAEQYYPGPSVWGIEIVGTAAGAFCDHYILEWKDQGDPPAAYTQDFIVYTPPAPPAGPGACGKVGSPLGYLETYGNPISNDVNVRLTVFSSQSGQAPCVYEIAFQIFEVRVSIENVAGINVPNWPDPTTQLTGVPAAPTPPSSSARVLSVGDALEIWGHAWVGTCADQKVKRYTLSYQAGFVTDPTAGSWTTFWQVDYNSSRQKAAINSSYMDLTSYWEFVQVCLPPFPPCPPKPLTKYDRLDQGLWYGGVTSPPPGRCYGFPSPPGIPPNQVHPVDPEVAMVTWSTQALPPSNCYSGQYTLRLTVEDTKGNFYYDTQEVWFDNKDICGEITGILGVPACSVIKLSQIPGAGNCNAPWPLAIEGISYDEFIIEGDTTSPSDNFGGYCMTVTRQGGAEASPCTPILFSVSLPVPNPTSLTTIGTNRVGDPGTRCATASPPPMVAPVRFSNILTTMDARMFDFCCVSSATPKPPNGFALKRADPKNNLPGECCSFWFALDVWDNTVCEFLSGGRHEAIPFIWPVYICNDLPPMEGC